MAVEANLEILRAAIAHFNDPATRESYFDLYAPEATLHRAPALEPGLDQIKAFYRTYWAAFPDIRLTIRALFGDGDFVACVFEARATHLGDFLGRPATGRPVVYDGVTVLRFEGGRCIERWSQTDMLSLLRQIEGD
ncbi:MAG: ester cyclase [Dehalococcoidia bacterium]